MDKGKCITVFTKGFLPAYQISLRHAVVLLVTGRAENLLDMSESINRIKTIGGYFEVTNCIRMLRGELGGNYSIPSPSCTNLLKRDGNACVYCGCKNKKSLTIDHVIPQSRGGKDTWENLVIACSPCNSKKGNSLLEECGMSFHRPIKLGPPRHKFLEFYSNYRYDNA